MSTEQDRAAMVDSLWAVIQDEESKLSDKAVLALLDIRVRLAAQQAPAAAKGEPVFLVCTGEVFDGQETYTRHEGLPPPLCDFEGTLYTAPPSAQQATGLLTDEQRDAVARAICIACDEGPDFPGDVGFNEFRWQDYRDVADAAIQALAAAAQAQPEARAPAGWQAGMDTAELLRAWQSKLHGVNPTDRQLSVFAVGVEVGFDHARELEKADWSRVHHALRDAGVHPGRTDEHLADVIARALAAAPQPASKPDGDVRDALQALLSLVRRDAPHLSGKVVGYAESVLHDTEPARLLQDEPGKGAQGLSRALASKPDARHVVRQAVAAPDSVAEEIQRVLTDPDSSLSDGSRRALDFCIHALRVRVLAAHLAPNEDAERLDWLQDEAEGEFFFDHTISNSFGGNYIEVRVPLPDEWTTTPADFSLREAIDAARKQEGK